MVGNANAIVATILGSIISVVVGCGKEASVASVVPTTYPACCKIRSLEANLGRVGEGDFVETAFLIENTGNSQLVMTRLIKSDGELDKFTKVEAPSNIESDQFGVVRIGTAVTSKDVGKHIIRRASFVTNCPDHERLDFFIHADVVEK